MELVVQSWEQTANALAVSLNFHFPAYGSVFVERALVSVEDLRSVVPAISSSRLASSQLLVESFLSKKIDLFRPVTSSTSGGEELIFPPLVEPSSHSLVLIDGVHRCRAASTLGIREITVFVVRAANTPDHVAYPIHLQRVEIVDNPNGGKRYFTGRNLANFRPGDEILHMARDLCRGGGRPPSTFSSDDCGHPAKDRRDSE